MSDTESIKSNAPSESGSSCDSNDLSLVAEFDDLMRLLKQQRYAEIEDKFITFVEQTKRMVENWRIAVNECVRLQSELDKTKHDFSELECQLKWARKLLDQEKKHLRKTTRERDNLEQKVSRAANILFSNQARLPDDTRQQLAFLSGESLTGIPNSDVQNGHQLSTIPESNLTESLISNFSYSRSEDDLDTSALPSRISWKKHRPSTGYIEEPAQKKRRSESSKVVEINTTDIVRATTTLTLAKDGPITATSIIESVPNEAVMSPPAQPITPSAPPAHLIENFWQQDNITPRSNMRSHSYQSKTIVIPEFCGPCGKRIRFGKTVLKCKECRAICHPECRNMMPSPCTPLVNTPQKGMMGVIGDFTPSSSPMVPALIVHSINEIESRGLTEIGIYRIPGSEKEVKTLKEKFLRGKCPPNLNQVDIHVICGVVKDFLRSLHEPLITYSRWMEFVRAVEAKEQMDIEPALYQLISELPQPNRDTLAYMIGHLKKVAHSAETKMTIKNLAKVFGPTIVGYSSNDPNPSTLLIETRQQCLVMEHLLQLPLDYWTSVINDSSNSKTPIMKIQQTPSMDSLINSRTRGLFSPYRGVRSTVKKNQKIFPTSP